MHTRKWLARLGFANTHPTQAGPFESPASTNSAIRAYPNLAGKTALGQRQDSGRVRPIPAPSSTKQSTTLAAFYKVADWLLIPSVLPFPSSLGIRGAIG